MGFSRSTQKLLGAALLAGLAGGVAEIIWVWIYCRLAGLNANLVASQIAASLFVPSAHPSASSLGMAIHLALSLFVGLAYTFVVWRPFTAQFRWVPGAVTAAGFLATIWAINFFLVLPFLNPRFVGLMPYPVTLISKILFGISMAWVLKKSVEQPPILLRNQRQAIVTAS